MSNYKKQSNHAGIKLNLSSVINHYNSLFINRKNIVSNIGFYIANM